MDLATQECAYQVHSSDQHNLLKILNSIQKSPELVIHNYHNIIVSAQHHRLSPGVLPHDVLNKIIKKYTTEVSENHHYIPLAHHPSDFSLIKTSNIINYKYDLFTLNLHIQLVALSNLLQLYKFIHLLLKFCFQANLSFTPDISHNNLITISHSKSFQALYSVDLYSCLHLWET